MEKTVKNNEINVCDDELSVKQTKKIKSPKKKVSKERIMSLVFVYGVLLWPVIHFCVYTIGMNFSMVIKSFQTLAFGESTGTFCGFDNYKDVILLFLGKKPSSGIMEPKAILNSLSILPISVAIDLPISLLFSYAIYKKYFLSRGYMVVLFAPCMVSAVVLCLVFNMMMSYQGFVPSIIKALGFESSIPPSGYMGDPDTVWNCILIFSVWTGISLNIMHFTTALSRLPQSVIESAKIDGATEIRQFFSIVVSLIWGTVVTIAMTGFASVYSWYMPSLLLTNGKYGTSTIGLIVITNSKELTHVGWTSALGVLIAVIGTSFTLLVRWLLNKCWSEVEY